MIDLGHRGHARSIAAFWDDGVIIDCGPASTLDALLDGLDGERPRALLITHVHLDHAAAAGALVARWPQLPVYVHERGARHLADPSRLVASAERIYGARMRSLWGTMLPVPAANLRVLGDGETVLGRYEVAHTPGHAVHHVCFRRGGTVFAGDVAGVRITPRARVLPPTPPPDVDVPAWHGSLERLRAWAPDRLMLTHFGPADHVVALLDELATRLDAWAELARTRGRDEFVARTAAELTATDDPAQLAIYGNTEHLGGYHDGLARYWARAAPGPPGP